LSTQGIDKHYGKPVGDVACDY